jgi:effector-binding domain-containing protein
VAEVSKLQIKCESHEIRDKLRVDIKVKTAPAYRVACITRVGPYSGQNMWHSEFRELVGWAKRRKVRTGKWIMGFIDEWGKRPNSKRRSVACIEVVGKANPEGRIKIMRLPKQKVASVTFDPDKVADRLVYHGIEGWLQYRPLKQAAPSREVYMGDPWTNHRAWSNAEVQVPIKRK